MNFLASNFGDDGLRLRALARVRREGHQRALDAGAADRGELVGGDAVAGDHHGLDALVAHLAHDQAAFGVQAAPVEVVGARALILETRAEKSFSPVLMPS